MWRSEWVSQWVSESVSEWVSDKASYIEASLLKKQEYNCTQNRRYFKNSQYVVYSYITILQLNRHMIIYWYLIQKRVILFYSIYPISTNSIVSPNLLTFQEMRRLEDHGQIAMLDNQNCTLQSALFRAAFQVPRLLNYWL